MNELPLTPFIKANFRLKLHAQDFAVPPRTPMYHLTGMVPRREKIANC